MSEFIIENKRGERKLITLKKFFPSYEEAKTFIEKTYKGHKLVGIQDSLFQNNARP